MFAEQNVEADVSSGPACRGREELGPEWVGALVLWWLCQGPRRPPEWVAGGCLRLPASHMPCFLFAVPESLGGSLASVSRGVRARMPLRQGEPGGLSRNLVNIGLQGLQMVVTCWLSPTDVTLIAVPHALSFSE